MEVVDLKEESKKHNGDLVDTLEYLLECAKSGELSSIAYACTTATNTILTGTRWVGGSNLFTLVGALELTKRDLLRDID